MNNPYQMIANFARQHGNPDVVNSPMGQEMLKALELGDPSKGEQLAQNYLNSNNATREQGVSAAQNFIQSFIGGRR